GAAARAPCGAYAPTASSPTRRPPGPSLLWPVPKPSAVDLAEHDVERAENGRDVGQHVAAAHEVHGLQMGEARRLDLAAVRLVGAVRHEVDAEFALGRLDGGVNVARRDVVAFRVELEVVDE